MHTVCFQKKVPGSNPTGSGRRRRPEPVGFGARNFFFEKKTVCTGRCTQFFFQKKVCRNRKRMSSLFWSPYGLPCGALSSLARRSAWSALKCKNPKIQNLFTLLGRRPEIRSESSSRALVRCARSCFELPNSFVTSRRRETGHKSSKRARQKIAFSKIGEDYLTRMSGLSTSPLQA